MIVPELELVLEEKTVESWGKKKKSLHILEKKKWVKINGEWTVKTTCKREKEDDLMEDISNTKKKKFEPIKEGCWGGEKLVMVVGLQPYQPLPQRENVARSTHQGSHVVKNIDKDGVAQRVFIDQSIRKFLMATTCVEVNTGLEKPNPVEEDGPFEEENKEKI